METYTFSSTFRLGDMLIHPVHVRVERLRPMIPAHRHSRTSYELHCTAEGRGTVSVNGIRHEIRAGDVYMTGPELIHEQWSDLSDPVLEYCLYLNAEPVSGTRGLTLEGLRAADFHILHDTEGEIIALMKEMAGEMRAALPDSEETACALLRLLLLKLNRESMGHLTAAAVRPKETAQPGYPDIEDAFFYRYAILRLEDIASMLNLSPRQTQRFLLTHYGKTFTEKRREAQMSAAAGLLENAALSVRDVSERVGFSSVEHFSGAFKGYFGVSPREYRKRK